MKKKYLDQSDLKLSRAIYVMAILYVLFLFGCSIWRGIMWPIIVGSCISIPIFQFGRLIYQSDEPISCYNVKIISLRFGKFFTASVAISCAISGGGLWSILCFAIFFVLAILLEIYTVKHDRFDDDE